ncbi:hypothetical protein LTR91_014021 [Friedmanniomyces endolithicus]|uniref:Uncharacterized protein n=1 Tax=Friedmanniomyces endolithicus TaxID=329885 RepID=A0AAN6FM02_9PEZI|nr:hypothetical protein LTR82_009253 [Friedmanniomyces endolithicus]KAK0921465.1 hypothetical protein LTR57_008707 [Friedmanniomyces endolithicus]KAK0975431.1 hypothetical protein LTR91_014021 [Friedmanniomyces endolithicus]KAK1034383.1 hypothetical protein LTS16_015462 [Friedmanniomyces endolithicus]
MAQHIPIHDRNFALGPKPDVGPGIAGLQMATSTTEQGTGPPISAMTIGPQEMAHIDELLRLTKELEESRLARDQACQERDAMADDLLKLLEDIEKKDEELKDMAGRALTWKDDAQKMSSDDATEMHRSVQVRGGDGFSSIPITATQTSTVLVSEADRQMWIKDSHRQYQMQLAQVEKDWRFQMEEEHKLRQGPENGLVNMKEFYETQMQEVESQSRIRIEELQGRMQELEIALQRESQQIELHSGWKEELDQLHQLAADQEVEINDQYQRAERFQRMSERLTTQVKHSNTASQAQQFRRMSERSTTQAKPANMADQALEQAEQVEQQHLEDIRSQVGQANTADRDLEQAEQVGQQRLKNVKSQSTESRRQRRKKQTPGSVQPKDPRAK